MWLVGIVFFPIIVYIVWRIYKYTCTLPIKVQRGIAILIIVTPFNDDCCHVYIGDINDGSGPVKYVYKFTGKFYGYVMLEYWQIRPNFKMDEEQKRVYQKIEKTRSYYGVSRCGEVFEIPSYLYF